MQIKTDRMNIHNYICVTGAHPASYLMSIRVSLPGGKAAEGRS